MANVESRRFGSGVEQPRPKRAIVISDGSGRKITLQPGQSGELPETKRLVDICIVFDTTGSMSDKIAGLITCMVDFVEQLAALKLDWQLTVVPFGDLTFHFLGDRVVDDLPFVNTKKRAQSMIRSMPRFNGGGNHGESSLEALQAAMNKPYRRGAVKVLVLLTDEPPLVGPQLTPEVINRGLQNGEFICFVASMPQQGFEPLALDNAGQWYPISSSIRTTDLLNFLRGLLQDVAKAAYKVHSEGGGSVRMVAEKQRKALGR